MDRVESYGKFLSFLCVGSSENFVEFQVGQNAKRIQEVEEDLGETILLWFEVETEDGEKMRYNACKVNCFRYA